MDEGRRVMLLTKQDCAFCHDAESVLARLGEEFGFSVTRVELESEAGREMAKAGGILFPPGIFVDGQAVCYGRPSERRLRKALGRSPTRGRA